MKKLKKNITIDDLARMVQTGFSETAKQKDMNKRFEFVDERFDSIEGRLTRIEKLIMADHEKRIMKLEKELVNLKKFSELI